MIELPEVKQKQQFDCGKAAAACVLNYYEVPNASRLITDPLDGTDPRTLEIFFRRCGFNVLSGEMTLGVLKYLTDNAFPVIAVLKGHYVVVAGVARGRVRFMCPTDGHTSDPISAFLARWVDDDRLGASYNQFGICVWRD